jgi:CBS domain-containing protein
MTQAMTARKYLKAGIPAVSTLDAPGWALDEMRRLQCSFFPVFDEDDRYAGVTSSWDLERHLAEGQAEIAPLAETRNLRIGADRHIFDALAAAVRSGIPFVPVFDEQTDAYEGAVTAEGFVQCLADVLAHDDPGTLVVVRSLRRDYTLTRLVSIIESHGGKVLYVHLAPSDDINELFVYIKFTHADADVVLMSFDRFGIEVDFILSDEGQKRRSRDHYDALMRYLEV